ncbi:MAG TPA: L,D-transpeptidase family protein [Hyphomicrobium sp.]|nr:L,D-transpeptidase family protein [Hyphomicrobium sp.]
MRCALGRGGIRANKREGDGATPRTAMRLVEAYYNPSRGRRPITALPVRAIQALDGWCDEPNDRNYNRRVRHPYPMSAERLWREDQLYDLLVVLDYNIAPRKRGAGSAIFMHVARDGCRPTEGCIALSIDDLRRILRAVGRQTRVVTSA